MAHETTLDNGLTLLVQEVHTAPLASVWCWYKVGSHDEGPGVTGVSHWVEHMNFKGTTNIPRDQVKGIIEQFGGSWNGYTWIDQTTYLETAAASALDRMLFIEAERMANCLYAPDDCESERTVIISELQGGENDPEQRLDTEITATAFKVHPYRHPTIGWLSDLHTMTRDDLYGHYRRYYVPNNATLVVVGDVETADVIRRVKEKFGDIAPGDPARRPTTVEPPQDGERRVHLRRPGTTAYWRAVFHAPRFTDPDFFPLLALDAILTGASGLNIWSGGSVPTPQRSARLYRALVNTGLASSVGGFLAPTARAIPLLDRRDRRARAGDRGGGARRPRRVRPAGHRRSAAAGSQPGADAAQGTLRLRCRQRDRSGASARLLRHHRHLAGLGDHPRSARDGHPRRGVGRGPALPHGRQPHHRDLRTG